jgi:hypothetical protein
MTTLDPALALLDDPALAAVAPALRARLAPALRLRHAADPGRHPDDTPLGADKLGGLADVPRSCADPIYRRACLLLQLDLGRASALVPGWPLPRSGLLHVLRRVDIEDREDIHLRLHPADEPLHREPGPKFSHRPWPLSLTAELTLPDHNDPELEHIAFPDDDELTYEAWFERRCDLALAPIHRLLGWPDWVQDPALPPPPVPARGWKLLVQLDSAGYGFEWGDSGCLYVLVPDLDLYSGRLDRAHVLSHSC